MELISSAEGETGASVELYCLEELNNKRPYLDPERLTVNCWLVTEEAVMVPEYFNSRIRPMLAELAIGKVAAITRCHTNVALSLQVDFEQNSI